MPGAKRRWLRPHIAKETCPPSTSLARSCDRESFGTAAARDRAEIRVVRLQAWKHWLLPRQLPAGIQHFQIAGELRPRILQNAPYMLNLRLAVFFEKTAGASAARAALVVKLHDVPRRLPG